MGNPNPTGIGGNCGPIDAGTSALTFNRPPGAQCSGQPTRTELERYAHAAAEKLASAGNWFNTDRAIVQALGDKAFTVGVVAGMAKNIVMSAVGLLDLVKMLAMADYHEKFAGRPAAERYNATMIAYGGGVTGSTIATLGAISSFFLSDFDQQCKQVYQEREVLIAAVKYAFSNPGQVFGKIVDEQKAKYAEFVKLQEQHTLGGEFRAGMLFGELLVDVLLIVDGVTALAKIASKVPGLLKLLPRFEGWGKAAQSARKVVARGIDRAAGQGVARGASEGAKAAQLESVSNARKPSKQSGAKGPSNTPNPTARSAVDPAPSRGAVSGRSFDPLKAGGPIEQLSTVGTTISREGIDAVEAHVGRFGPDPGNEFMIDRLRRIADGKLSATQRDLNYYTHELREFERYKNLGWKSGQPASADAAYELWNNAHTATLEDYRIKDSDLFHPEAPKQ